MDEEAFREGVARTALSFLGTQYRWAGKGPDGIDCSGLAFISYMENGVLIYRDAAIREEYPIYAIGMQDLKKGDLIFFPGHVAVYLGDGKYVHSTGYWKTPCVTVNSLKSQDPDFREDLSRMVLGYGSLYPVNTAVPRDFQWLRERLESLPGSVSMVYENLATGERYAYNEEAVHPAASLIKLFLMAALFEAMEAGELSPDQKLPVPRQECVPSCGVLTYLQDGKEVSVRDLIELMIIVSDNTATNLLLKLYGEERFRKYLEKEKAFAGTVYQRKMFDEKKAALGLNNVTTARAAAALLKRIGRGELVSEEASQVMKRILSDQRLNGKIPFYLHTLEPKPLIAHKTGEDSTVTHDAALIDGPQPFVLCFLGSGTDVPALERLMGEAACSLYRRTLSEEQYLSEFRRDADTPCLVTVCHTRESEAQVCAYVKDDEQHWRLALQTPGFVGKYGTGKVKEGDCRTPLGVYDLTQTFGILPDPGAKISFFPITPELYWCSDEECYNRLIDIREHPHNCEGEHLIEYVPCYNYGMVIDYNKECRYPEGSAIFFHCTGSHPYTGGCVSVPEAAMKKLLQIAEPGSKICIYDLEEKPEG